MGFSGPTEIGVSGDGMDAERSRRYGCGSSVRRRATIERPMSDRPQPPILNSLDGRTASIDSWEARAEYDLGVLICRYLQEHPAPAGSAMAERLREYGEGFRDLGAEHLAVLDHRRLSVVGLAP